MYMSNKHLWLPEGKYSATRSGDTFFNYTTKYVNAFLWTLKIKIIYIFVLKIYDLHL